MAANELYLIQRNGSDTANVRRILVPSSGKQVVFFDNGTASFLNLLDTNGEIFDALIPKRAKPRVFVAANQAARFALTQSDVQNGDIVWQDDEGKAYFVVDDTQLNVNAGYKFGGTVTLNWADIQNKPTNLAYKVPVPASSTAPGNPGESATDDDNLYVYVGDGTTHKWLQFLGNTF